MGERDVYERKEKNEGKVQEGGEKNRRTTLIFVDSPSTYTHTRKRNEFTHKRLHETGYISLAHRTVWVWKREN